MAIDEPRFTAKQRKDQVDFLMGLGLDTAEAHLVRDMADHASTEAMKRFLAVLEPIFGQMTWSSAVKIGLTMLKLDVANTIHAIDEHAAQVLKRHGRG